MLSASHAKCAALVAQIQHDVVARLQSTLERVIAGDAALDELNVLSEQIAGEQQALAALEDERMREFTRLFQFSHQVRVACGVRRDPGRRRTKQREVMSVR